MRRALILAALLVAGPAAAQTGADPCAGADGQDLCATASLTALGMKDMLPRELTHGIRAQTAVAEGPMLVLNLVVAADLGLPDPAGFARLVCTDPALSDLIAAGGKVTLRQDANILATITTCQEVN